MNSVTQLMKEYRELSRILAVRDFCALAVATMKKAPDILRTKKLTSLDVAMSRNVKIRFHSRYAVFPLADIDHILSSHNDNPTFGNIREMCARDCYLSCLNLPVPVGKVLDLGANRGMFSLLAIVVLDAEFVVGVEPLTVYEPVMQLLLEANQINPQRVVRYNRFITSPSTEQQNPTKNISIDTICREQGIKHLGMVKIDIEGHEKDLFREPEWLARVDTIAMEVHPHFVDDLSLIPKALEKYGFNYLATGRNGEPCEINKAMFLYASRTGALAS